jgi:O-antigen ligase
MFKAPWVAGVAYLAFGVMQPQYIWFWHFESLPISPSKTLAIFAISAWLIALFNKQIDFEIYKRKQNLVLLIMWIWIHLSHITTSFPGALAYTGPELVLTTLNTIMILYFVSIGILTHESGLKYMSILMAVLVTYYVYWANDQYLSGNWAQFTQGRLRGPNYSIYRDENVFSTLFMVGMPFILYGFFYIKHKYLKFAPLLIIPLLWHSLFLIGSRGAMIATLVSTFISSRLCQSKLFNKVIVIGFIVALTTQGGAMLNRSSETYDASQDQSNEEAINPRLLSWEHGLTFIKKHPITGVGVQKFQQASRVYFPGDVPYVAHNTFLQLAANSGLLVGLLFLYLFKLIYQDYRYCVNKNIKKYPLLDYSNKAITTSLAGFFVSAIFLDLMIFEAFYYLLTMNIIKQYLFEKRITSDSHEDTVSENVVSSTKLKTRDMYGRR